MYRREVRRRYLRDLHLIRRTTQWLRSPIPWPQKLSYYGLMLGSYARLALTRRRSVRYLGAWFDYDNPATPLNLQTYPFQVATVLGQLGCPPATVLDVGANIGQFAVTLAAILPSTQIDAFEPNRAIFPLLESNCRNHPNVRLFCAGVGRAGEGRLFFELNRSSIGSQIKRNAGDQSNLQEITIALTNDVPASTGRSRYDLVVIDVEGAELDVVRSLSGVTCRYALIEISGLGRQKPYAHSELLGAVAETFGPYEIVWISESSPSSESFEVLLRVLAHL